MTFDILVKGGTLPDGRIADVAIADGKIAAVEAPIDAEAGEVVDAAGKLVSSPFVDPHFHMDATLSYGTPRVNASGTLLEGIALWGNLKALQTREDIVARALTYCRQGVTKGLLAIRSHVDVTDPNFKTVEALLEVREHVRGTLDLQLVALPQDGWFRADSRASRVRAWNAVVAAERQGGRVGEHGACAGGHRLGHCRALDAYAGELRACAGAPRPDRRRTARARAARMIGDRASTGGDQSARMLAH